MNKLPSPNRLLLPLLSFTIIVSGLLGCNQPPKDTVEFPAPQDTVVDKHVIPIEVARQLTADFRASIAHFDTTCTQFADSMHFGHAEAWPTDVFVQLLKQHNEKQGHAKGIRIYFGRGPGGEIKLVMVPYDKDGNDMIDHLVDMSGKPAPGTTPIKTRQLTVDNGQAVEEGQRCPTLCDDGSSGLN